MMNGWKERRKEEGRKEMRKDRRCGEGLLCLVGNSLSFEKLAAEIGIFVHMTFGDHLWTLLSFPNQGIENSNDPGLLKNNTTLNQPSVVIKRYRGYR